MALGSVYASDPDFVLLAIHQKGQGVSISNAYYVASKGTCVGCRGQQHERHSNEDLASVRIFLTHFRITFHG